MVSLLWIVLVGISSRLLLPRHSQLPCNRVVTVFDVELADLLSFVLLPADQHAVEVGDLP